MAVPLVLRSTLPHSPALAGPFLRRPTVVWVALFANVLAFATPLQTVTSIPAPVGQLLTQGALPLAFVLALLANPAVVVRPHPLLLLLSTMAVLSLMVSIHNEFMVGSTYRAVRLVGFVAVLWLLSPHWGRPDFALLRAHLACLRLVLAVVVLGAVISPGTAFSFEGRLSGALWPIPPTQVAHYAAILLGCTAVLWFTGLARGRSTGITLLISVATLLGAHTRTALIGVLAGLLVAGASLFAGHVRVRRTAAVAAVVAAIVGTFFMPLVISWASRGQTTQEATQLTGRTKVWGAVFGLQRPWIEQAFGNGLSNKSYQGLPIDSNWVASYLDSGWAGIALQVGLLLTLLLVALARPSGPRRALALFLVGYCVVASITETGLGDASPYLLELVVAGSLLAVPSRAVLPRRAPAAPPVVEGPPATVRPEGA